MSTSEVNPRLRIEPATRLTEITVSDARFRKITLDENVGPIELELPPGVYEIGFRDGTSIQQHMVVLQPGQAAPLVLQQEPRPVDDEDKDDESALRNESSQLVVSVRDRRRRSYDEAEDAVPSRTRLDGLSLVTEEGTPVEPGASSVGEALSLLPFPVRPGRYRLRVQTGAGDRIFETPVIVCPGWRTQVWLRTQAYRPGDYRADFATTEIRMRPADGSRPPSEEERILERNACGSLAARRTLGGRTCKQLLRDLMARRSLNPMFGLYVGYLLRGSDPEEIDILAEMVTQLEELVSSGPDRSPTAPSGFMHPDVNALRLRLSLLRKEEPDNVQPFPFPPMLAESWRTILQIAQRSHEAIPAGSLCDRIANRMVAVGAATVWTAPSEQPVATEAAAPLALRGTTLQAVSGRRRRSTTTGAKLAVSPTALTEQSPAPAESLEVGIRRINAALHDHRLRQWFRETSGVGRGSTSEDGPQSPTLSTISKTERMVAQAIHPIAPKEELHAVFERARRATDADLAAVTSATLAAELRLPTTTVGRAISRLSARFSEQGRLLNINLEASSAMSRPELIIPYDPDFLGDGFTVPFPKFSDALRASAFDGGAILDYTHFSLAMHAARRVAIVTAHNIDAARTVRLSGGLTWRMDERAGEYQLGRDTYDDNQLDKGHLVRREDVLWGTVPEAKLANKATYFYTNAAPQHKNFNQDEWLAIEDWVLDKATDFSYRLCVFTGPVLRSNDPVLTDLPPPLRTAFPVRGQAQIPAAFWKVVVLRDSEAAGEDLSVVGFAMRQTEMWNDRDGRKLLSLKVHQVTLAAIEEWTGLDFGELKNADELAWSEERTRAAGLGQEPEWPLIRDASDIVYSGTARRLRGLRVLRSAPDLRGPARAAASSRHAGELHAGTDCGCGGDTQFDAQEAIAALGREVARLTEVIAEQGRQQAAPAESPPTRLARSTRAAVAPSATADDARIERMVAAAPDDMKDAVRKFASTAVTQFDIASGAISVPPPTELERIVGGNRVQAGAVPSCVCVGDATNWFCSGVIVAPRVVLTAAHCGAKITRILIGDEVLPTVKGRVIAARAAIVHPKYRADPLNENDINVVILDAPAAVAPARIATAAQLSQATEVHLVGFGYNDPRLPKGFGIKREVRAPMGPLKRSPTDDLAKFEALTGFHADYEFVAGRKGLGKDTCNGDSGGPAYVETDTGSILAGLTSRATRDANVPCGAGGIYVRPDYFRDWINSVLAANDLPALP